MSKFKVGDKVIVVNFDDVVNSCGYEMNEIVTIKKLDRRLGGFVYWFEEKGFTGLKEKNLELIESKKTYTIQEVLVEENVGRKFEFNTYKYECALNSVGKLSLLYEEGGYVEDEEYLFDILNGTFTLIEEPKPFTEEIDFREAFKRLCDGEEVKFGVSKDSYDIFIIEDNVLKFYSSVYGRFEEAMFGIETLSYNKYTRYYKK